jgi:hypothetical protein
MKAGKTMMKSFAIFCWILMGSYNVVLANGPTNSTQTLVLGNEKEGVYLYATRNPDKDMFADFKVIIGKEEVETNWESQIREERQPELHVVDLNNDGQKEIVVIITKGTGTWVVEKEAHILQKVETMNGKSYEEMYIDNPVHTVERDFTITATDKMIRVRGRGYQWQAVNLCGETYFHHRFPLYQSVNWKVEGNELVADIGLTITSNCVPAGFLLHYKQKGEIYVAEKVEVNL